MNSYEEKALYDLKSWEKNMLKKPSLTSRISKGLQNKANDFIPDKVHVAITEAIKNMIKAVLIGSKFTTKPPMVNTPLEKREILVMEKLNFYRKTATLSGAGTGAGGILLGLADFPVLLSIKIKFLFDTASLYGFNVKDYKERLYILHVFLLAFSSDEKRIEIYEILKKWNDYSKELPEDLNSFDWRSFQQEYRDYIDLAKMLQLVPGIGALVGAYANYQLMEKLGKTAMNAYRLRVFKKMVVS
ncbi:EcsC family protein [Clostridium sp. MB40-C1]|uniref:EcsC family protein n=1 Tax=Clostridium sp. MB40-C1 TaxID=3070996 RepID=UPI0027E1F5C1|nr:EcsC family protein [Clostridium sp. MB40-C1]WMJ82048.1 EcsC family protein [Clostridium sp. MB40-C1]